MAGVDGVFVATRLDWLLRIALSILWTCLDLTFGETTQAPTHKPAKPQDDTDMLKGMAAGFGGFVTIIVLICVLWCCCCSSDESSCCKKKEKPKTGPTGRRTGPDKSKVAPSPPQSAATWSRNH